MAKKTKEEQLEEYLEIENQKKADKIREMIETEKNLGGQPPKYGDPKELIDKAMEYIAKCVEENESPMITGMCLYLGFCSRQSFYDYMKKPNFSYALKRLHLMIESVYESKLTYNCVTGIIFALKNLGWKDTSEIHQTGNASQGIEVSFKKAKEVDEQ